MLPLEGGVSPDVPQPVAELPAHLLDRSGRLEAERALEVAVLDVERFEEDLSSPKVTERVRDDMLDAEAMDITSVPTFFINGVRHVGPYDARTLVRALTGSEAAETGTQPEPRADA